MDVNDSTNDLFADFDFAKIPDTVTTAAETAEVPLLLPISQAHRLLAQHNHSDMPNSPDLTVLFDAPDGAADTHPFPHRNHAHLANYSARAAPTKSQRRPSAAAAHKPAVRKYTYQARPSKPPPPPPLTATGEIDMSQIRGSARYRYLYKPTPEENLLRTLLQVFPQLKAIIIFSMPVKGRLCLNDKS